MGSEQPGKYTYIQYSVLRIPGSHCRAGPSLFSLLGPDGPSSSLSSAALDCHLDIASKHNAAAITAGDLCGAPPLLPVVHPADAHLGATRSTWDPKKPNATAGSGNPVAFRYTPPRPLWGALL